MKILIATMGRGKGALTKLAREIYRLSDLSGESSDWLVLCSARSAQGLTSALDGHEEQDRRALIYFEQDSEQPAILAARARSTHVIVIGADQQRGIEEAASLLRELNGYSHELPVLDSGDEEEQACA
ncbi:MAG: hypothetical protein H6619_05630 [Deltaproteobacteria bacterium]|nr:hypothetical protein [Deltaproteobacteria bacterium]